MVTVTRVPRKETSGGARTVFRVTGVWTIDPLDHAAVATLVRELEVSEVTAAVLVRRGYGDPDAARRFL